MMFDAVIISPNTAIDSYYELDQFVIGSVNQATRAFHTAGGKGLNLARAMKNLGGNPFCLGLIGGESGRFILNELKREGIASDLVSTNEETRRCNTIYVKGYSDTTVILEKGKEIDISYAENLINRVLVTVDKSSFHILTGSLPAGFPTNFYAQLVQKLKEKSELTCVDSCGEPLLLATEAGAGLVMVNRQEFEQTFLPGGEKFTLENGQKTYNLYHPSGLQYLIVTDGANGAIVFSALNSVMQIRTKLNSFISSAGAGDTFLAALILKVGQKGNIQQSLAFASASAAASMQMLGCGFLDVETIPELLTLTQVETVAI